VLQTFAKKYLTIWQNVAVDVDEGSTESVEEMTESMRESGTEERRCLSDSFQTARDQRALFGRLNRRITGVSFGRVCRWIWWGISQQKITKHSPHIHCTARQNASTLHNTAHNTRYGNWKFRKISKITIP